MKYLCVSVFRSNLLKFSVYGLNCRVKLDGVFFTVRNVIDAAKKCFFYYLDSRIYKMKIVLLKNLFHILKVILTEIASFLKIKSCNY